MRALAAQPSALRRCLDNLVWKCTVRYGGLAQVTLHDGETICALPCRTAGRFADAGARTGDHAVLPCRNLAQPRKRGAGLGVEHCTGHRAPPRRLVLSNAPGGGLLAEVLLPRRPGPASPQHNVA